MSSQNFDPMPHLAALRRYARSLTRDAAQAEDLVHDALVRAYEKSHAYRGDNLGGWLLSILHSVFVNSRRSRLAEQARIERHAETAPGLAEPAQEHSARLAQIQGAFLGLPDEQRAALHLVAVEGLSYAEAAAVTAVPVGTLMSRLGRARAALRDLESGAGAVTHLRVVGGQDD